MVRYLMRLLVILALLMPIMTVAGCGDADGGGDFGFMDGGDDD